MTEDYKECGWNNNGNCLAYPDMCAEIDDCEHKQLKRLEQELKWANDEEKYLKECCIKAGKELEKNSFAWDGKEKNLVVQALELNKRYEILKQENKALKDIIDDGRAENKRFREENDELKKTVENQKLEYEELQCDLSEVENACGCYQSENAKLKQENKELKDTADTMLMANDIKKQDIDSLREANDRLEQENEVLTRENENRNNWITSLNKKCEELIKEKLNYRSALEEIKNNLKEVCKEECDYTKPKFCGDCDCRYGQILNKINEVLS